MEPETTSAPRWRPLNKYERRLLGVLVEKAKTTPEQYPLTVNGLVNGANQKNNRDPQMSLDEERVQETLDSLRSSGAVTEMQGSGRVPKYRHMLYDWLGVEKVELAVMAELLLRGAQTEGELRGRAGRMESIADLPALRTVLASLRAKNLVIDLTPPGRGQIISHNLYLPEELERLQEKFAGHGGGEGESAPPDADRELGTTSSSSSTARSVDAGKLTALIAEVQTLRDEISELTARLEKLERMMT